MSFPPNLRHLELVERNDGDDGPAVREEDLVTPGSLRKLMVMMLEEFHSIPKVVVRQGFNRTRDGESYFV